MSEGEYNVAIVGVTGAVGEVILHLLEERDFPLKQVFPIASSRSAGTKVEFKQQEIEVQDLALFDFSQVDIAFFSAGSDVSEKYVPIAADAGAIVIDNTSFFRYKDEVPLVIPEVNPEALLHLNKPIIIANPNCSTIQMLVALKPIYDKVGIEQIQVATYQAVSGAGNAAIEELARQTVALLSGQPAEVDIFPEQIAFNVLPQIDVFEENGFTREEMKMVWETHKIMGDPNIEVNPTAVRVPVFYGHSEAIYIETGQPFTAQQAYQCLRQAPGVFLLDDAKSYPTAVTHAASHDEVFVGRIRQAINNDHGLNLWVVADNIRKGAALNAIQIAELLTVHKQMVH